MRRFWVLLGCVFVVVSAVATTISPMTIERLTRVSELIVEGRSGNSWAAWDAQHTTILTYSRFQVTRTLKGAAADAIIIKQIGGHADGYSVKVAGMRYLQPGEEHVLFLHSSLAADGSFVIAGLMQGDFRVHRSATEATVSNGVPALHEQSGGQSQKLTGRGMSLTHLEERVRAAVTP